MRLVLGVALVLAAGAFTLAMSGRAHRIVSTDHINPVGFVASVPSGGTLCQPAMLLPSGVGNVEVLVGTYGHPVPRLTAYFTDAQQRMITSGVLAAGARQGYVRIPLRYPHGATTSGTLCIKAGKSVRATVLAGDVFAPGPNSEQVEGKPSGGRIDVTYLSPKPESWWQMLGNVDERFGFGKSSLFGDWTLPAVVLLLLGTWVAVVRLLVRELG